MPVTPTYPGVYIEELPSGVRPIAGVATSIGAFIDDFRRGPQDAAVQILGMPDFERIYGGLWPASEGSYGIKQFFLNGGTEAWVVRVCTAAATPATGQLRTLPLAAGALLADVSAGRRVRGLGYDDPGAWGNALRMEVDYDTDDPATSFNLVVSEVVTEQDRAVTARTETFRNLVLTAGAVKNAEDVVNESSVMLRLTIPTPPPAAGARPAMTGTTSGVLGAAPAAPMTITNVKVTVDAAATDVRSFGPLIVPFSATSTWENARATLESTLQSIDPTNSVSEFTSGATVQLVRTSATDQRLRILLGRPAVLAHPDVKIEFAFNPVGNDVLLLRTGAAFATANAQQLSLTGGADGLPPGAAEITGVRSLRTGLYALEEADLFNLLCIPQAAALTDAALGAVVSAATAYCEERRSFMLLDIPERIDTLDGMQAWIAANDTLRNRNLAVYFPRPQIPDPLADNRLRSVGASGTIAGLYARTDVRRGVWKSPAGTESVLRGVATLDFLATDGQSGVLNPIGVNVLRTFPIFGNVCWGARTMDGADVKASEWKYIAVRRTANYIEESLFRSLKWVVFEPNDEPLWSQIRLNVGAFMHGLFRKGAFQGRSARDAYFVKCDSETTTQSDIDLGVVNIVVAFAPLKPAEFVVLQIQQLAGKIEV